MARITVSSGSPTLRLDTTISPTRAPATVTAEPGRIKVALIDAAQKVHLWLPGHACARAVSVQVSSRDRHGRACPGHTRLGRRTQDVVDRPAQTRLRRLRK